MKNLKIYSLLSLVLLFVVITLVGCTKEDNSSSNATESAKVSNYLKSFYKKDFKLGKSVDSKLPREINSLQRTIDFEDISITEVFVGNDTRARGYIITDKITNDFLYFIDVNRVDFELTSVKIDANETKTFNDINELDKYLSTDELDYIKIVEDFNNDPSLERRRFWGSQPSNCVTEYVGGGCTQQFCDYDYYVFWISVEHLSHIPTGQMDCD
jgi:hypothetical protein